MAIVLLMLHLRLLALFFDCWHLFLFGNLATSGSIIFYVELDPTKFYYISTVKFVVEVVLCRFGISYHYKHLVVDVFVGNRVSFII